MTFRYVVEVEIKNDGITGDNDPHDLAMMLQYNLEQNMLSKLPWVIRQEYQHIKE